MNSLPTSPRFLLDVIELETKGAALPALAEDLPGFADIACRSAAR